MTVAAVLLAAAFFAAVFLRGWPSFTVTFGSGDAVATQEDQSSELTPAVGFAIPVPEDDWGDDEGPEDPSCGRSVGFRR